jgi:hypothetical protein
VARRMASQTPLTRPDTTWRTTAMTSSTSSDPSTARRDRMRFPPRSKLPPDVTVLRLPLLGTSWYKRGFFYWIRRIGISVIFALVLVAYLAAIEGVLQDISKPGTTLYYALAAGEAVFTLASGVLMFRRLWQAGISGKAARSGSSRAGRAGAGIGALAFSVGGVLAGLLVLSSVLTSGIALALFAIWLVPVPPTEQYARRVLAEKLQLHRDRQQFIHQHADHHHHRKR